MKRRPSELSRAIDAPEPTPARPLRRWAALAVALGTGPLACDPLASDSAAPPPIPLPLRIVGDAFEWHVRYPGADGVLDTEDDVTATRDVHLPSGTPVEIQLGSTDYIYGFRIPDLGVNEMAVPDLDFRAAFVSPEPGTHALMGDQMCGYAHESLIGEVVVLEDREFGRWLEHQRSAIP